MAAPGVCVKGFDKFFTAVILNQRIGAGNAVAQAFVKISRQILLFLQQQNIDVIDIGNADGRVFTVFTLRNARQTPGVVQIKVPTLNERGVFRLQTIEIIGFINIVKSRIGFDGFGLCGQGDGKTDKKKEENFLHGKVI